MEEYRKIFEKMREEVLTTRRPLEIIEKYRFHFDDNISSLAIAYHMVSSTRNSRTEEL